MHFSPNRYINPVIHEDGKQSASSAKQNVSPYAVLLREPICSIVTNVPDRQDLRFVSILGYN
jgi:hypothetical protein